MPRWFSSRRISNPFKEESNVVIRYATLLCFGIGLCFLVLRSSNFSTGTSLSTVSENGDDDKPVSILHGRKRDDSALEDLDHNERDEAMDEEKDYMSQEEFAPWLEAFMEQLHWPKKEPPTPRLLNRDVLFQSQRLGCTNMVENQKVQGNFNYEYNFVKRGVEGGDMDVRQADGLWGISLCYQFDPSHSHYKSAVEKGIRFFMSISVPGPHNGLMVRYPDSEARRSVTGTNALFGLGMIEYLRTTDLSDPTGYNQTFVDEVRSTLDGILKHLQYMQLPNKHFAEYYQFRTGKRSKTYSPYSDGESMLCFIKAAQYIDGYHSLIPVIEEAAPILAKSYSIDAWLGGKEDSDMTKGFYQWSSMFLTEYFHAGWTDYNLFGDFVIMLGHWIIYTHNILKRTKNTGYAFEGIISAYEIAKVRNDQVAMNTFAAVIDEGLYKLTTWQVGGPFADKNEFLKKHPSLARHAVGGVMGAWNDPKLRIDTTQHQMHAIMMAINTVYRR